MVFMENSFFEVGRVHKNRLAPPTNKNAPSRRCIPLGLYVSEVRKLAGVALILALAAGCGEGGSGGSERDTEGATDIRKQVYDLTRQDLEQFPVWEFALDEEGEPGQDEATVKPRADLDTGVAPEEGLFVVRAEFKAADGSAFDGFVTPEPAGDLGAVQPSVVTNEGHVSFWFGMVKPDSEALGKSYATLGVKRGELFPITFRTVVPVNGRSMDGDVPGFMYLDSGGETRAAD
jgi:hypothetical protein